MDSDIDDTLELAIMSFIRQSNSGVGIHALAEEFGSKMTKRKLQRLLSAWVEQGRLYRLGGGRGTCYKVLDSERALTNTEEYLPLTQASQKIIEVISLPLSKRRPVSYNRELLDMYKPNVSQYLPPKVRAQLHQLGKTNDQHQVIGTYGREIVNRLLIDLSWASSRLEGNTYTQLDTKRLIDYGKQGEGKDFLETQMILNHKDAIRYIVDGIEHVDIDRQSLMDLHGLLSEDLLPNPEDSGKLRTTIVEISGTVFRPLSIPQVIEECFHLLLTKGKQIKDPFEQSFFLMVHVPYLQPYIGLNAPASRLCANIPLLKHNLRPLAFIDMPEKTYVQAYLGLYELNDISMLRDVYVMAYERSAQHYFALNKTMVEPDPVKLSYRREVKDAVRRIVRASDDTILAMVSESSRQIPDADRDLFERIVITEVNRLHEGVLAQYQLTREEFERWKQK